MIALLVMIWLFVGIGVFLGILGGGAGVFAAFFRSVFWPLILLVSIGRAIS